ncbi:hypothetical protein BJ878DRAFT_497035 [Calycina marina]|uniref:RING-type domain-containing protein n=1 Tax=Calycina marina TaxID=1763456 RepID=A0A9P7Z7R6_9HELO|nr:hypothetical protein BJ878DRAFT_497035 [Calycina marina]
MNPIPSNSVSTSGGKSISISSHGYTLQQQSHHLISPGFESASRRSSSVHQVPTHSSPRNSQGKKKAHRNLKRPQLASDEDMAETSTMRNSRRGQTSITHLMNITLPPRPQDYGNTITRGSRRSNIYGIGSGHHVTDKARFIHANYRFIVKPGGNYKSQAVNSDEHLEWNDVLQILASTVSQESSCPICLSHPVAPRMAKCGHIFCLPCLIRYMHSTDDTEPGMERRARWKKCPICWDSIYLSETRPVRWYTGQEGPTPREGDDVVLRLVMRQPGSILALPRDGGDVLGKADDVPWYLAAEVTDYARIMKGGEEYMISQFDNEIEDLKRQENEDELMFGEEPEWTRKAVNAVNEAREKMRRIGNPPALKKPAEKQPLRQPIQFIPVDDEAPEMYFLQASAQPGSSLPLPASAPTPDVQLLPQEHPTPDPTARPFQPRQHRSNDAHHPDAPYFFYQALLHHYLAPLDIRILKSAFGNFASFPSTLLPRVERVSTGHTMDDDLRKRSKYLAHLPYGCEVSFLECNWTDVVAPEILEKFKDEIEKRRKINRDKENREEKYRLRAEKAEDDARWANARRKRPIFSADDSSFSSFTYTESTLDASKSSPPWPSSRQETSFATLASPSSSPPGPRTVWGTTLPAGTELEVQPARTEGDDGWLPSWEQELLAENELIAQVEAATLTGESSSTAKVAGGKKKKRTKITLMSTTARRAA